METKMLSGDFSEEYARVITENIESSFKKYDVNVTATARRLFIIILNAQVEEYKAEGINRIRRISSLPIDDIARYYQATYKGNVIDVDRMLHLIVQFGLFLKPPFPAKPTRRTE
jgi:hypothetical protein